MCCEIHIRLLIPYVIYMQRSYLNVSSQPTPKEIEGRVKLCENCIRCQLE